MTNDSVVRPTAAIVARMMNRLIVLVRRRPAGHDEVNRTDANPQRHRQP